MPDSVVFLLIIVAVLILADLLLAGGTMTMTCASAAAGLVSHPIGWIAIAIAAIVVVVALGPVPWR